MAISSIIAVFTTNTLLKRKQYGVLIANGLTQKDITLCITAEITVIVFLSTLLAWVMKLAEFMRSTDLFREVLLTAHIQYTLPICLVIAVVLVVLATLIPAIKVFQYQPGELIGGNTNGNY
jgi:ABC-type antimicrobial peptide transport system permease subunit